MNSLFGSSETYMGLSETNIRRWESFSGQDRFRRETYLVHFKTYLGHTQTYLLCLESYLGHSETYLGGSKTYLAYSEIYLG